MRLCRRLKSGDEPDDRFGADSRSLIGRLIELHRTIIDLITLLVAAGIGVVCGFLLASSPSNPARPLAVG